MENIIIEKVSETDYKRITTIPEVVIPQTVKEEIVSLEETVNQIKTLTAERDQLAQNLADYQKQKDDVQTSLEKKIAELNEKLAILESERDSATKAGVIEATVSEVSSVASVL